MPGTNSQAVAEHTLGLMLAVLRRLIKTDQAVRAGMGWSLPPETLETVGELAGRTVGLVGFGAVPRRLVSVLDALGARWIYHSRAPVSGAEAAYRTLPDLLRQSDIVSLHVPSSPETRRLIDAESLAMMKPKAILINTARGDLIDEDALADALEAGALAGAGLDVFANEPPARGSRLLNNARVVLSPHSAALTRECAARMSEVAAKNVVDFFAGTLDPRLVVNRPSA